MKKIIFTYFSIFLLIFLLTGCVPSLNGTITISDTELEAGEVTNVYLTISRTNDLFGNKPTNVDISFSFGEGIEVLDDSYNLIKQDTIQNIEGTVSRTYKVRAKSISAQQIKDNVIVTLTDNKGFSFKIISQPITVSRKKI